MDQKNADIGDLLRRVKSIIVSESDAGINTNRKSGVGKSGEVSVVVCFCGPHVMAGYIESAAKSLFGSALEFSTSTVE